MTALNVLVSDVGYGRQVVRIIAERIRFDEKQSFGSPEAVSRLPAGTSVTFIVPVLGDDELVDPFTAFFDVLGRSPRAADKLLYVVLVGDVHPSDPGTVTDTVVVRQIRARLRFLSNVAIFPKKLAGWNVAGSVDGVARLLLSRSLPSAAEIALARFTTILQAVPVWTQDRGLLELVDETGSSPLAPRSRKAKILAELRDVPIRRLRLPRAGLRDADLKGSLTSDCMTHLDLSSNAFERLDFLREQMPSLIWISVAANALLDIDLSVFPDTLQHLYLHKNRLDAFRSPDMCPSGLITLSVYRNMLASLPDLGHLKELKVLNLGANPINQVPNWAEHLGKLTYLGLAETSIEALPEWVFDSPTIQEIDLCGLEGTLGWNAFARLNENGIRVISRNASYRE